MNRRNQTFIKGLFSPLKKYCCCCCTSLRGSLGDSRDSSEHLQNRWLHGPLCAGLQGPRLSRSREGTLGNHAARRGGAELGPEPRWPAPEPSEGHQSVISSLHMPNRGQHSWAPRAELQGLLRLGYTGKVLCLCVLFRREGLCSPQSRSRRGASVHSPLCLCWLTCRMRRGQETGGLPDFLHLHYPLLQVSLRNI